MRGLLVASLVVIVAGLLHLAVLGYLDWTISQPTRVIFRSDAPSAPNDDYSSDPSVYDTWTGFPK